MTTLAEFWDLVPTKTDAELKQLAMVFSTENLKIFLEAQGSAQDIKAIAEPFQTEDGKWMFCADLLREFHPSTASGLYGYGYADILQSMMDSVQIENMDATYAKCQPDPPDFADGPPLWDQPVPGRGQWYDMGYPFGALVKRTINGTEYVRRSLIEFNSVDPAIIDARYWEFYPPQAIPWQAGQVWNIGDVVYHVSNDLPENDTWQSKINANTTEPNTDAGFYRYWDPIGESYDPSAPKPFVSGRAYNNGEKCVENGNIYKSILEIPNVWAPSVFPTGWEVTGPA